MAKLSKRDAAGFRLLMVPKATKLAIAADARHPLAATMTEALRLQAEMEAAWITELRLGRTQAIGVPEGANKPEPIPSELWSVTSVEFDYAGDSVIIDGRRWSRLGIRPPGLTGSRI